MGYLPRVLAAAALAAATSGQRVQAAGVDVAGSPIDWSVYREGAVKRVDRRFGSWVLTCDEIASLSRKFCSLRGNARAADGTIIAAMAVSTDDGGRPAALVTLPFGTVLSSGTLVLKGGPKSPAKLSLRPALCDGQGCEVIWALTAADVRTLSAGIPLRMSFDMAAPGDPRARFVAPAAARVAVEGALPTDGFADALHASIQ